jgi:hypothetical protein
MTSGNQPSVAFWATILMLTGLTLYAGAYLAMVRPVKQAVFWRIRTVPDVELGSREVSRKARNRWLMFFWPALQIDCKLRPSVWQWQDRVLPEIRSRAQKPSGRRDSRSFAAFGADG